MPMPKTVKLPANVILRGNRYYIRIPADAKTNARRRVATWIGDVPGGEKAAAKLLARVENLLSVVPPRWDLLQALNAGTLTLRQFDELMVTRGIPALEEHVANEARRQLEDKSLLELAQEWPALSPNSENTPQEASIKLRSTRVEQCARALRTLGNLTENALREHVKSRGKLETQRAHRNDIAMFCEWLIEHRFITTNPARKVKLPRKERGEKKIRFHEFGDLMLVYEAMTPGAARDAFGFMIATAAETGMCQLITSAHLERDREVHIPGTKTNSRARQAIIEAWFMPRLRELLANTPAGQPLMPATRFQIADEARAAVTLLIEKDTSLQRLRDLRPYDARHSWAVRWLRDKRAPIGMVAGQLGHVNNEMVVTTYGVYIPKNDALLALDPEPEEATA
ncbi:MAG: hypothetical protein ACK6DP_03755 [Gemmatimonas sp.]|uniref:hypothetical protein n=1 Tax=Gemmatimonas sp. TaxID=1962908 RepID=UPI00391F0455